MSYSRGDKYHHDWPDCPIIGVLHDGTAEIEAVRQAVYYAGFIQERFPECFCGGRPNIEMLCHRGGYLVVFHQIAGSGLVELCPTDEECQFLIVIDPELQEGDQRDKAVLRAIARSFLYERGYAKPVPTGVGERVLKNKSHRQLDVICDAFCRFMFDARPIAVKLADI